jgi:hypothetical protein
MINYIRFLTFVRNDNISYYDTVSQGSGNTIQLRSSAGEYSGVSL